MNAFLWLLALPACGSGSAPAEDVGEVGDGALSPGEGVAPWDPSWPDAEAPASGGLSLVLDGVLASDGDRRTYTSGPARSARGFLVEGVLVHRGGEAIALDAASWLEAPGWTLARGPAPTLAPGESTDFAFAWSPAGESAATVREDVLRVGGGPAVVLEVTVPRPNRAVLTGDGGWWATSDDGGRSWTQGPAEAPVVMRERAVVWGEGRFFRAWATGQGWFEDGRYAWSEDGATWSNATVADDFWPSDCTWGLERFLCVRSDAITWSDGGASVIHEATRWANMLNGVAWTGSAFVGVGRGGRRVLSQDGATWDADVSSPMTDEWRDVACHGESCVAVGGSNRLLVATSADGGRSWTEQAWPASQWAGLSSVVWTGAVWMAAGTSNDDPQVLMSLDGDAWTAPPGLARNVRLQLLGAIDGAVFGERSAVVHRSLDGVVWDPVVTPPSGATPRALAVEDR